MRRTCRHPRLLALFCRVYAAVVWTYPPDLRREFGRELQLTFRNQAEDALERPTLASLISFALHIATDWGRTVATHSAEPMPASLLGLGCTESVPCGTLDRSTMSLGLLLATLGVCLMITGWYGWLNHETTFLRRYAWTTEATGPHHRPVRVLKPKPPARLDESLRPR
jgi:hypothetical protein